MIPKETSLLQNLFAKRKQIQAREDKRPKLWNQAPGTCDFQYFCHQTGGRSSADGRKARANPMSHTATLVFAGDAP
jgi:hypothetical protein